MFFELRSDRVNAASAWRVVIRTAVLCLVCTAWGVASARDNVRLAMQLEPPVLDPTISASASVGEMTYANVYEGLTVLNGQGQIQPRLATAWTVAPDRLSYEFTLRKNVTFHDGQAFNAQTALYSIQRILQPELGNPQRMWFDKVADVEVKGPYTLTVRLKSPDALLPFALALPAAAMVHPGSAESNREKPVGTGPYRFVSWAKGDRLKLQRYPAYWGKVPKIEFAEFVFSNTRAEVEALTNEGLVDGLINASELNSRFILRPDYHVVPRALESKVILAINNGRAPFNDVRVRRAITHALDRVRLAKNYERTLKPQLIGSHFAPTHPAYVDLSQRYPYDPALARKLLSQAGVKPGTRVKLAVPPTSYGRSSSAQIAADLQEVGFTVNLEIYDWKRWMSDVFGKKDYDLTLIAHVEPMDLNIYARDNYYFNYNNKAFKALWQKVMSAPDEAQMNKLLGDAQRMLAEDAVNAYLFMLPHVNILNKKLDGVWERSPIAAFVLEDLYWKP